MFRRFDTKSSASPAGKGFHMTSNNIQDLFPPCRKTKRSSTGTISPLHICATDESGKATFLPIAWVLLAVSATLIVAVLSGRIPESGVAPAMVSVVGAGYLIVRSALVSRA
jgi:hypothetical protein